MQKLEPPAKLPEPLFLLGVRTTDGRGRGRKIGIPTINIAMENIPDGFRHGIYACRISFEGKAYAGAMHYGPRPVFQDSVALEVHVLDEVIDIPPEVVDLEIVGRIRDVLDFPDTAALLKRIDQDIAETRAMLSSPC